MPRHLQWRTDKATFTIYLQVQTIATMVAEDNEPEIEFVSLGMFIIDEIEFATKTVHDILGGAGTYSAIGARIVSPPPKTRSVGWIVDAGNDFPNELRDMIKSWETSCLIRATPWRQTTRGWNGYGANEHRGQWLNAELPCHSAI